MGLFDILRSATRTPDVSSPGDLDASAARDAQKLIEDGKQHLLFGGVIENTQSAVERGAFGSPTFFVGREMFFGKEQLREVEELVAGT